VAASRPNGVSPAPRQQIHRYLQESMTRFGLSTTAYVLLICVWQSGVAAEPPDRVIRLPDGSVRVHPIPVPEELHNPWPSQWEEEFWRRANHAIRHFDTGGKGRYGNTFFENEKASYPKAMFDFLAGHRQTALKYLQEEDVQAGSWHKHTAGIDYYACFTLKGQMRKYFFLGQYLQPDYRRRMYEGAKAWTAADPLAQPHPVFGKGKGGVGWGPDVKGACVDVRSTDNLRAMRETSVYLMAEETGNEQTRLLYKQRIAEYVISLYQVGMSEWDSENYHTHTIAPYLNLYDFAKDPEVRRLAKAALDWLCAAGAVKYYRGGFGGPSMRDYGGGNVVFGSGASHMLALWFGDTVIDDPDPHYDDVHAITSSYRPPQAVVHLARKNFPRPVELLNTKPLYAHWRSAEDSRAPRFWETLYFGRTFQLGSLVSKGDESLLDMCRPMSLMALSSKRGVDYFVVNTNKPGEHALKRAGDQIGQYRNLLVWLRPARPAETFYFQWPRAATVQHRNDIVFIALEKTWLAIWPIHLEQLRPWPLEGKWAAHYRDEQFHAAATKGDTYAGFALLVGEQPADGSFEQFVAKVSTGSKLDLSNLAQAEATIASHDGHKLTVVHNAQNDLPTVHRNGQLCQWEKSFDIYKPLAADGPISLGWRTGTLRVSAGGQVFECTVTAEGKVSFSTGTNHRK